jgi:ATP-dependent RNA helicase DDX10/DBP4
MAEGKGLVFLLPTEEEGMKKRWEEKGLEVKSIKIKESKMGNLKQQMQSFAFRDPEIKYLGQRVSDARLASSRRLCADHSKFSQAFVSYLRSVHLQKDKSIFKLTELPFEAYAASLGLPGAPQIKFVEQARSQNKKNALRAGQVKASAAAVVNTAAEVETPTTHSKTTAPPVGSGASSSEEESDESGDEGDPESEEEQAAEQAADNKEVWQLRGLSQPCHAYPHAFPADRQEDTARPYQVRPHVRAQEPVRSYAALLRAYSPRRARRWGRRLYHVESS